MVEVPYKRIHVVLPACLKFVPLRIFRWQILSGALPFARDCFNRMGGRAIFVVAFKCLPLGRYGK